MCTAVNYNNYFGRNLDYEHKFGEEAVIVPKNFPLPFRFAPTLSSHPAIIGIAKIIDSYPLFFDGMNEKGVACAGLNFVGYAHYNKEVKGKINIPSFEFIPYILTHAESVLCAKELLKEINITSTPFSKDIPPSQLHFIISDKESSLAVESTKEGLKVYDNPVEVLTNNPEFPWHMTNLSLYLNLTSSYPENRFSKALPLSPFSRGMGAMGIPGDLSSPSRFIRGAFARENAVCDSIGDFFHILSTTKQILGISKTEGGKDEMTEYSSAYDRERFILYYTTYTNRQITAIDTKKYDLNGHTLLSFPLKREENIMFL